MKVVVFSLVKDRLFVTRKSFESLYMKTRTPFKHIIIDQGSTPQFTPFDDCQVVYRLEENIGISAGTNLALESALQDADVIIKFDPDCEILTDGAMDECIKLVIERPNYIVSPYIEGLVRNRGGAPRVMTYMLGNILFGRTVHLGGVVTVARNSVWRLFGKHQTPAPLHGNQDSEFSSKMIGLGFIMGYLEDFKALHMDNEYNSADAEYWNKRKMEKATWK